MNMTGDDIKPFERIFNVIGWLGFIFVVPIILALFGLGSPLAFLQQNLGQWGSPGFLLIYFFGLQVFRILFGSGRVILPLIMGGLTSFLIIAAVIPIGFMEWFRNLLQPLGWFYNSPFAFLIGLLTMIGGYAASYRRRMHVVLVVLFLLLLPVGLVALVHYIDLRGLTGIAGTELPPFATEVTDAN